MKPDESVIFRECSPEDLDLIIKIGRETYYDTFHSRNRKETMDSYLAAAFAPEKIAEELDESASRFFILYTDNKPSAYFKINFPPAQSDRNEPGTLELERIYVRKEYKGRGLGRSIIRRVFSIAAENNCRSVWLGVWENNDAALAFYNRMGFREVGRHGFRMGDELQTDLILEKDLNRDLHPEPGAGIIT